MTELAAIPLPEKRSGLTIRENVIRFPTMPGKARDVVHMDERVTTVQCAACLRTATAHTPWTVIVVHHWNHECDDRESRKTTPYKRCPECRAAGRHPEETT